MTFQEAITMVEEFTEGRVKRLTLFDWAVVELQRICARKRYWWRRKSFTFTSTATTPTYDLSASAVANVPDFLEMIHLVRVDAADSAPEVRYEADPMNQNAAIADSATPGTPAIWFIEPGTTKTIRLSPTPDAALTYRGLYWAFPSKASLDVSQDIPLIPEQMHYVLVAALTRRLFLYLFGQNDPRYPSSERDFEMAMADLDHFGGPATREAQEFRQSSGKGIVRSTS